MTTLVWDQIGEKTYETGVDKGVLYLNDGTAVVWNGLTSVEDTSNSELKSYYLDGVKFLNRIAPGDFAGKLKAYTYPDEFDKVTGIAQVVSGLFFHDQNSKSFSLAYRTKVGDDVNGLDRGYKIHLLYNLVAVPDSSVYETLKNPATPIEFAWTLSGIPQRNIGYRPTAHISIDSSETDPAILEYVENLLYGTDTTEPRLPDIREMRFIFESWGELVIYDNGDGTWTASDVQGAFITLTDPTTFTINDVNSVFLDSDTYQLFDTTYSLPSTIPLRQITLRAPDSGLWVMTATTDGTLDIAASTPGAAVFDNIMVLSPSNAQWAVTVTNDGTLDVSSGSGGSPINQFQMKASDNSKWKVTINNDGTLNVTAI